MTETPLILEILIATIKFYDNFTINITKYCGEVTIKLPCSFLFENFFCTFI